MMEEFEQMSLTEASFEPYRIKNKIRLIELFGGIGAQAKALEIRKSCPKEIKVISNGN
jgi:hypothetical protein